MMTTDGSGNCRPVAVDAVSASQGYQPPNDKPPLTLIVWPVTCAAPSEAKKTATAATSSADGGRPNGKRVVAAGQVRPPDHDSAAESGRAAGAHCRGKKLAGDVDLGVVARGTPGFSGADLANLVNEAAINAVRGGREVLTAADFSDARDRVLLGRREGSNVLLPEEKQSVAVHKAGVAHYGEPLRAPDEATRRDQ